MSDDRDDERNEREAEATELARMKAEFAREADEHEPEREREARELERMKAELAREAEERAHDGGDHDDPEAHERQWEQRQEKRWAQVEQAWRRHVEQRERWESRHAEHRARWTRRHKRWRQFHEEREMWMRMHKGKRAWVPWWLQARIRRRIFSWLTIAFASGAAGMYYWPELRWWHALVALFVLSGVSGAIAIRLTRPLLMVVRVAQDIGDGKLETRLDVNRHRGETRLLAVAINEMVAPVLYRYALVRSGEAGQTSSPITHVSVPAEP